MQSGDRVEGDGEQASDAGEGAPGPRGERVLGRREVEAIEGFARGLAKVDLTFLALRDELYGGSWDEVEHDLRARLEDKPFIFKLAGKIEESLQRIARLRRFEETHGVDLRQVAGALKVTGGSA